MHDILSQRVVVKNREYCEAPNDRVFRFERLSEYFDSWFRHRFMYYEDTGTETYTIDNSIPDLLEYLKRTKGFGIHKHLFTWLLTLCAKYGVENLRLDYVVSRCSNVMYPPEGDKDSNCIDEETDSKFGFGDALVHLNYYDRVYREGWDKFYKYIKLQVPPDIVNYKMTEPYIYICMDNDKYVPWTPTYHDLLATDWKVYHD